MQQLRVAERNLRPGAVAEHEVEFRESEDERIALVDQRDVDVVAQGSREPRGGLEAGEARAEDDDSPRHARHCSSAGTSARYGAPGDREVNSRGALRTVRGREPGAGTLLPRLRRVAGGGGSSAGAQARVGPLRGPGRVHGNG